MSTTVSVRNDSSQIKKTPVQISPVSQEQEKYWSILGNAIGYPDSWISIMRQSLSRQGKVWVWRPTNDGGRQSTVIVKPSEKEAEPISLQEGGKALLIINSRTPSKAISNALLLAENCNASISVIYTAKLPLMSEAKTPGEVDSEFAFELENGRRRLEAVAKEARNLGVRAQTSFIWSNSSSDLVKRNRESADLIIDETS